MKKIGFFLLLVCFVFGVLVVIRHAAARKKVSGGGLAGIALSVDCTANNKNCPPLSIAGDRPQDSKFHGFADPSMRRDPVTGTIWMAYSWPNIVFQQKVPVTVVSTHLAKSTDNGRSWSYVGPVWEPAVMQNPLTGRQNVSSFEVPNIVPRKIGSKTLWYGVTWSYLAEPGKFIYSQIGRFSYLAVYAADSPEKLGKGTPAILGAAKVASQLNPTQNLTSLNSDLSDCITWNEPALTFQDNKLFLAARCQHYSVTGSVKSEKDFYALFFTSPEGEPDSWQWQYAGKFLDSSDAGQFGYSFWSQLDFARKSDGTLLVLAAPASTGGGQGENYDGVRVMQMASMNPPALMRDEKGKIKVLAAVVATDLKVNGTGSSCYEPDSETGIIFTRKLIKDPTEGYFWMLHKTGLKP